MKRILVTGGAGYIGSITINALQKKLYQVCAIDNLSNGHQESLSCELVITDLRDSIAMRDKVRGNFDAVIHFAASALAGESMQQPFEYFDNNLRSGLMLLEFMKERNIPRIIFSSSCAVFGSPQQVPVNELAPKNPDSVYGESKLMFEKMLSWYEKLYGISYINLRYFNAAGASLDSTLGERHFVETHIIPTAMQAAIRNTHFSLRGTDYSTPDGTCIRDYIHVEDLAQAHIAALEYSISTGKSNSFNLGSGKGYSNLEVIKTIEKVSNRKIAIKKLPRRAGDPPMIYADNTKAKQILGFTPQYSDLETIITTAWKWHKKTSV